MNGRPLNPIVDDDGSTDCRDQDGRHFGEERLVRRLLTDASAPARLLLDSLFQDITDFVNGQTFGDDITAFPIDIHGHTLK